MGFLQTLISTVRYNIIFVFLKFDLIVITCQRPCLSEALQLTTNPLQQTYSYNKSFRFTVLLDTLFMVRQLDTVFRMEISITAYLIVQVLMIIYHTNMIKVSKQNGDRIKHNDYYFFYNNFIVS